MKLVFFVCFLIRIHDITRLVINSHISLFEHNHGLCFTSQKFLLLFFRESNSLFRKFTLHRYTFALNL